MSTVGYYVIESTPVDSLLCMGCGKWLPAPKGTTRADLVHGVKVVEHLLPGYRHVKRVCPGSGQVVTTQ